MALVRAGLARGVKQVAPLQPGKRTKRDGQVIRTEGGRAHLINGFTHGARRQSHAVDVAQFALIGAKPHRGVALDVLDRLKALANGKFNVAGAHIILIVHKSFGPA